MCGILKSTNDSDSGEIFRATLGRVSFNKALEKTSELWRTAPYVNYYLDPAKPEVWPDPWTLLAENYYCDVAKSLGIIYTIYLSEHRQQAENFEFRVILDQEDKYQYNLACFDNGKYVINYWPTEIVNIEQVLEKDIRTLYQYSSKDLALEKY